MLRSYYLVNSSETLDLITTIILVEQRSTGQQGPQDGVDCERGQAVALKLNAEAKTAPLQSMTSPHQCHHEVFGKACEPFARTPLVLVRIALAKLVAVICHDPST